MPDPPQNLDINKTLIYLLQRMNKLEGGSDDLFEGAFAVVVLTLAAGTEVFVGGLVEEGDSFSPVLPAFADTTAVDSTGAAASESDAFSPVLPSFAVTTQVI